MGSAYQEELQAIGESMSLDLSAPDGTVLTITPEAAGHEVR